MVKNVKICKIENLIISYKDVILIKQLEKKLKNMFKNIEIVKKI